MPFPIIVRARPPAGRARPSPLHIKKVLAPKWYNKKALSSFQYEKRIYSQTRADRTGLGRGCPIRRCFDALDKYEGGNGIPRESKLAGSHAHLPSASFSGAGRQSQAAHK